MVVLLAAEDGEITRLGLKYKPGRASRLHKCSSTTSGQTHGGDNINSHAIGFPPALAARRTLLAHPHCSGSPPPFGYRPHAYLTEARHLQYACVCSSSACCACPGLPDYVVHIWLVLKRYSWPARFPSLRFWVALDLTIIPLLVACAQFCTRYPVRRPGT